MPTSVKQREKLSHEWLNIRDMTEEVNGTNLVSPPTRKIAPTETLTSTTRPCTKRQADFKLDYMESLMIKLHKTGPGNRFNEDKGRSIYTKQWNPLLIQLRQCTILTFVFRGDKAPL